MIVGIFFLFPVTFIFPETIHELSSKKTNTGLNRDQDEIKSENR